MNECKTCKYLVEEHFKQMKSKCKELETGMGHQEALWFAWHKPGVESQEVKSEACWGMDHMGPLGSAQTSSFRCTMKTLKGLDRVKQDLMYAFKFLLWLWCGDSIEATVEVGRPVRRESQ